jgi:hypothetical protein
VEDIMIRKNRRLTDKPAKAARAESREREQAAAHEHRLDQARALLRRIGYVPDPRTDGQRFIPLATAADDRNLSLDVKTEIDLEDAIEAPRQSIEGVR